MSQLLVCINRFPRFGLLGLYHAEHRRATAAWHVIGPWPLTGTTTIVPLS